MAEEKDHLKLLGLMQVVVRPSLFVLEESALPAHFWAVVAVVVCFLRKMTGMLLECLFLAVVVVETD